ncbi:DUF4843 domain-containing protein [Sphingobacterium composti Ten et al. 2007 non Yoo et al. 2007]|uniref:DUF4843 domain-containing protein n=1 Tax=Sphingobacterium composti TaxID=363260 RepID=UPI001357AD31|nr:DUF4843 domain-containing protein [Sphingobacterium composti Ten et al. 2007 non Yoo et al. 2007]
MRNTLYIIILSIFFYSCDKNNLIVYTEDSGIYFDNRNIVLDTINVPWGLKNSDIREQKIKLEVNLFGKVADYDRSFNIKILDTEEPTEQAKAGIDYLEFPMTYTIPKGQAKAFIEINLLRTEALKSTNKILTIELEESDDLKFLYSRKLTDSNDNSKLLDIKRVIRMNENFPQPAWWGIYGTRYFGTWSMDKSILICDLMGINREKWAGNSLVDEDFNESIIKYAGVFVHRWLAKQDPKILDSNGQPMEMGWDSKR